MNNSTNITFYHTKRSGIEISIIAQLDDGKLSLQGHDHGPRVEELRGMGEDYENTLSLDKAETKKLLDVLGIADKTDIEKLEEIKKKFGKSAGISTLEEFCDEHEIKTKFSNWP